jgi:hypothetical protein
MKNGSGQRPQSAADGKKIKAVATFVFQLSGGCFCLAVKKPTDKKL